MELKKYNFNVNISVLNGKTAFDFSMITIISMTDSSTFTASEI